MTGEQRAMRVDAKARAKLVLAALSTRESSAGIVTMSVRDIAIKTGISRGSVSRALTRLITEGSIQRIKCSSHTAHASRYRILNQNESTIAPSFLWSHHGFGSTAALVFMVLNCGALMSVKEIAEQIGCSTTTARNALHRLHSAGLVDGINLKDDRNPRKTHWRSNHDSKDLARCEELLTDSIADSVRNRLVREQRSWARSERARIRNERLVGLGIQRQQGVAHPVGHTFNKTSSHCEESTKQWPISTRPGARHQAERHKKWDTYGIGTQQMAASEPFAEESNK